MLPEAAVGGDWLVSIVDMHLVIGGPGDACEKLAKVSTTQPGARPVSTATARGSRGRGSGEDVTSSSTMPSAPHGMPRSRATAPWRKLPATPSSCQISERSRLATLSASSLSSCGCSEVHLDAAGDSGPDLVNRFLTGTPLGVAGLQGRGVFSLAFFLTETSDSSPSKGSEVSH